MKMYNLIWRDGKNERIEGESIANAFTLAGYSAGALKALDYYEEVTELPSEEKHLEYTDENGNTSKIVNPEFIKQIRNHDLELGKTVDINFANRIFKYTLTEINNFSLRFHKQKVIE